MESSFPSGIQDFTSYMVSVMAHVISQQVRLGIDTARVNQLTALYGDPASPDTFLFLKTQWDNKTGGRTTQVVTDLRTKMKEIKIVLMDIFNDIPGSKWTNIDRSVFNRKTGLKRSMTHQREAITELCYARPQNIGGGKVKIACFSTSESSRASLPKGADSVMAAYAVIDPVALAASGNELASKVKAPRGPSECTERVTVSRASLTLDLGSEQSGNRLYLFTRWYNTKHADLAGPWSALVLVNVV